MDKDLKLKLRPFYLAQILYERTDEDHSLSTAELMEILENEYGIKTHRQRIPADVEVLRSFGMEIQEIMSSQKRYNLISREYDIAEIKLLIDAVESSKFITKKKSEELVAKLSKMAGRNQAENLRRNIAAEDRIKYDNESIYLIIDGINEAINAGKQISFLYFKYDVRKEPKLRNEGKPWIFSPHKLVWNGDFYYMVGVFDNGKRVGTFRVDRIMRRPDILEVDALPFPADFDFDKYLQTSFRMYGTKFTTVDLICKNDVMDAILDKFGKDVTTYAYDMENFRAEVDVVPSSVFYSWVFGFGGDVVINGPANIKEEYRQMVQKVADSLQTERNG
jgi:predicted DNA-binding transcriptional regulator YafY